jgi:hypothetical protein
MSEANYPVIDHVKAAGATFVDGFRHGCDQEAEVCAKLADEIGRKYGEPAIAGAIADALRARIQARQGSAPRSRTGR